MNVLLKSVICTAILALTACTAVKPWEKGNLAQPHMALDPLPACTKYIQQVYEAKEGSARGYSVGGGGCGCN